MRIFTLFILFVLTACTELPDFGVGDDVLNGPYPGFLPADQLVAQTALGTSPELPANRLARLRARAAALRGDVLTPAEQSRLNTPLPR